MKSQKEIQKEITALERLGRKCADDKIAQASVQGQIDVLMWVTNYKCEIKAKEYA